ncbi:hypothetical protein CHS0354_013164 [Potamilus streckersoni]|uniref:Uncharacterized protein n=1 Tax=Potamilus streckersoni TaxID=2493646 RepID=A0AAE0T8U2_9BIVA|nr:hypothetical protein CHS0354_013164 [Potamilus streckersoni]
MTAWMMALAAVERYFKILQHSAYPFTFSSHNMKVLVMGLGMLVVIVAVGPIYGFGEYSCLLGYFEVITKANSTKLVENKTTPSLSTSCADAQITPTNQSLLRDPISALHEAMTSGYGVQIGRIFASTDNIRFYFQVENATLLENLRIDYMNGRFAEFMFGVFDKIPTALSGHKVNIIMNEESFHLYRRLFLPIQGLGQCSVNMFSPNLHSDVWIVFHVFVSFLIPYGVLLTCYAILYLRTPMTIHNFRPNSRDEWVCTNVFCISGVTACLMSLLYFSVLLAIANRAYVTPSMVFFSMCCYYSSGTTLCVAFVLNAFYYKAKIRCKLLRNRWRKENNSIEMSEV